MQLFRETFLLFALNLLDALLTLFWVRNGMAEEANHLMAKLLEIGDFPFLAVKLAMGTLAAVVLLKWSHYKMARYGVSVALAVYVSLMGVHLFTGLAAFGYLSGTFADDFTDWTRVFFALFV